MKSKLTWPIYLSRILRSHRNHAQIRARKIPGLPRLKRKISRRFCPAALRANFALQNSGL